MKKMGVGESPVEECPTKTAKLATRSHWNRAGQKETVAQTERGSEKEGGPSWGAQHDLARKAAQTCVSRAPSRESWGAGRPRRRGMARAESRTYPLPHVGLRIFIKAFLFSFIFRSRLVIFSPFPAASTPTVFFIHPFRFSCGFLFLFFFVAGARRSGTAAPPAANAHASFISVQSGTRPSSLQRKGERTVTLS